MLDGWILDIEVVPQDYVDASLNSIHKLEELAIYYLVMRPKSLLRPQRIHRIGMGGLKYFVSAR